MTAQASAKPWDYSSLAASYELRPDYHAGLLGQVFEQIGLSPQQRVCDVGAGTGKLTRPLCRHGSMVIACEPNPAMRAIGAAHPDCGEAHWIAGHGEAVPLRDGSVDLCSYGSSFNVLAANAALAEARRLLKPGGHWLALWNHRDLTDPLQTEVEALIHRRLPDYRYGSRREDPSSTLRDHGGFAPPTFAESRFQVRISTTDWTDAWRSHATLKQQAGGHMDSIVQAIERLLDGQSSIDVPYFTRVWWTRTLPASRPCR